MLKRMWQAPSNPPDEVVDKVNDLSVSWESRDISPFPPLGVRFCRPAVPKEFKILGSRCLDVFSSRPTAVPLPSRRGD